VFYAPRCPTIFRMMHSSAGLSLQSLLLYHRVFHLVCLSACLSRSVVLRLRPPTTIRRYYTTQLQHLRHDPTKYRLMQYTRASPAEAAMTDVYSDQLQMYTSERDECPAVLNIHGVDSACRTNVVLNQKRARRCLRQIHYVVSQVCALVSALHNDFNAYNCILQLSCIRDVRRTMNLANFVCQ